jgi:NitT/TauT family transport system ATP-binding protein
MIGAAVGERLAGTVADPRMTAPAAPAVLRVAIDGKRFPALGEAPPRHVLGPLRLTLRAHEVLVVTGPSGCGKTTLLNLVAGLDEELEGRIERPGTGRLAYVFQEPRLLPWRTVAQNLALVLPATPDRAARIAKALAEVGLAEAATTYASRLSLGMARRVALARAFVVEPDLLLLDEPFASLDRATAQRLRLLLLDLLEARRAAALFVTHDLEEAVMLGHRLVVLTASPASVAAELPIALAPAARRDEAAVAARTAELRAALRDLGSLP